jgi:peptidoglycan-associated lipoprotein
MKHYISVGAILTLLLTGCAQKSVEIEGDSALNTGSDKSYTQEETTTTTSTVDVTPIDSGVREIDLIDESKILAEGSAKDFNGVSSIYFDFDRFNVRADMQSNIENNVKLFKNEENSAYTIKVEGNCDEWGTDEYNYALGLKRAKSIKDVLVTDGIDENRMVLVSYGESNPICAEHTKECWSQNRRVDFKLLP